MSKFAISNKHRGVDNFLTIDTLISILMFLLAASAVNATSTEAASTAFSALFGAMAAFMGLIGIIWVVIAAIWVVVFLLVVANLAITVWAIYDILTSKNDSNWKLLWAVIILFTYLIGVLFYYFMGRKERKA